MVSESESAGLPESSARIVEPSADAAAHESSLPRISDDTSAVLDRIADPVVALDRNGVFTYSNAEAARTLGREREVLVGTHMWTEFPHLVGQKLHLACERAMTTGEATFVEEYSPSLGRWFEHRTFPSPDGLTICFQDITARKQNEESLRDVAQDLAVTFASVGDAVMATDALGRVTRMNPTAQKLTGWTLVEASGKPLADVLRLVEAHTREPVPDVAGHVLETNDRLERSDDVMLLSRDGNERAIAETAAPIRDGTGEMLGVVVVLSDQTARYATRRALAESEERLRLALRSANQGLYDLNVQTGDAMVTPEYATMLGYDAATFRETNTAWIERLHPDDHDRVTAAYADYISGKSTEYRVEFRQRTKSGNWCWILSLGRVVARTPDGQPSRMLGTHTDINERKLNEEALRRSERDLAITLKSIGDAVIATDASGLIVRMNATAERMTGWTSADATGRPLSEVFRVVNAQTRASVVDPVRSVLEMGEIVGLAYHTALLARDGREFQIADSAAPIRDDDGLIVGVVLVFSDVTGQYRVQQALREREQLLRTIIENEPECVKVISADGQLREMNAAGLAMLEVDSLEEAQRVGLMTFLLPENRPAFVDLHRRVLKGESGVLEFEIIGRKGTRRWLETHAAPLIDPGGSQTMLLGITRDITERKRAEEERRHMESQMRSAERMEAVGQLAGGVAHDFNNLLSVINCTAELAIEATPISDPVRQDLVEIRRAGERAATLTGQLLAFSRSQIFAPEFLDVNALLLGMRLMLSRIIREDIDLRIHPSDQTCLVHADRGQLERVVMNLAINARDAMPRGGRLVVETSVVALGREAESMTPSLAPGSYVVLSFTDTGEGMAEDTLAHLFEPFFTTKGRGRGTGLGLSSSYGIVVQSGGAITVSSAPGRGSTFQIYLPRADVQAPISAGVHTSEEMPRGSETILIVDDEEPLLRVAKRILESAGYTSLTATSGAEALRLAERVGGTLHLLITDVVMPEMGGPELAARLVALHPETRVLYSSGYSDDVLLRDAVQDRSTMLIGKPYSTQELRRTVREALDRSRGST